MKSSTGDSTLNAPDLEKPEEAKWQIPGEKAAKSEEELLDGTNRFEGTVHKRAVGSQRRFCLARRRISGARTM